ncbi:MerR family transcriptional regulator [Nesterenkonia alba]|uniref:MerR family transcriptional regulator n=1 Tax=Nesterenkonia alba TaxID=515814 RepID=UPI0003B50AA6|nr:MerR family transcriptional regulator [Nesterenkonia alba]
MYSIGEFAATTGLTVKALRHYDEIGLLQPASVDPYSRYRRYEVEQLRPATIIKVLREAGLGVDAVRQALETDPQQALIQHREEILAQREHEDAQHAQAQTFFAHLEAHVGVTEQQEPAQPWVAQVLELSTDDLDRLDDDPEAVHTLFDQQATHLRHRLQDQGITITGHPWTTGREGPTPGRYEILTVYPVDAQLPAAWGGDGIETGVLPARYELQAEWEADPADSEYGEHMDPRTVLFLEEADRRGALSDAPGNPARTGIREENGRSFIWVALTIKELEPSETAAT